MLFQDLRCCALAGTTGRINPFTIFAQTTKKSPARRDSILQRTLSPRQVLPSCRDRSKSKLLGACLHLGAVLLFLRLTGRKVWIPKGRTGMNQQHSSQNNHTPRLMARGQNNHTPQLMAWGQNNHTPCVMARGQNNHIPRLMAPGQINHTPRLNARGKTITYLTCTTNKYSP